VQPRYLRVRELATTPATGKKPRVAGRYPVGPATIWRWVKEGRFPKPVILGPQTTAWRVEDLDAWDAQRGGASS
jgi:prophage regulatory protein